MVSNNTKANTNIPLIIRASSQKVPNVPTHTYGLTTYQEWEQRLETMIAFQLPKGYLILYRKIWQTVTSFPLEFITFLFV